jgi:hypothetical protein
MSRGGNPTDGCFDCLGGAAATSLFTSHIFDFVEGWMYVLGVGVAGGMMLRNESMIRETSNNLLVTSSNSRQS